MHARAEIAGFRAFGSECAAIRATGAVFLRGHARVQRLFGGRARQVAEAQRRARCDRRFFAGDIPFPPIDRTFFPDGLFGIGGGVGRESVLQDVVEAEGFRVFSGSDGDQMERALGAGHGDVEQAQFFEGFALAMGG